MIALPKRSTPSYKLNSSQRFELILIANKKRRIAPLFIYLASVDGVTRFGEGIK
jgi:hypothetical protein